MNPDGDKPEGGNTENMASRTFDWHVLRKAVCNCHFQGRSIEHCPKCKDRMACFDMIEKTLKLVDRFRHEKSADKDRQLTDQQGVV
jgi:hypothetical protein